MKQALRVIYAGTPEFAVAPLAQLLAHQHVEIIGVLPQPDRPVGRGKRVQPGPVKLFALEHQINVLQPASIKNHPDFMQVIKQLKPDLMVVAAYGLILPAALLAVPIYGCINIHASLLPKWRGAAPIQRAVLAGDQRTGISIMQMDQGLDTGDILLAKSCTIESQDTAASLHDKLSRLGAVAIVETLDKLVQNQLKPVKQNALHASYAEKIVKDEAKINWSQSAETIIRCIRAFNPKPVAFTYLLGKRIRIWQAHPTVNPAVKTKMPGTIIAVNDCQLVVQCGQGALSLEMLQLPGKKVMEIAVAIRGHKSLFQSGRRFTNS